MASEDKPNRLPWQPLTFKGIARLGRAPLGRLMAVQCVVAAIVAASVLTTVLVSWKPVITETLLRLPDQGGIRDGTLAWFGPEPVRLANNSFLSVVVELIPNGSLGLSADLQLEFGRRELRSRSILGYLAVPYPVDWVIPANRKQLEPWWGAWNWPVMGGLALGVFFGLQVLWWLLAVVYAWPVRLIAFYSDRQISLPGCASIQRLPGGLCLPEDQSHRTVAGSCAAPRHRVAVRSRRSVPIAQARSGPQQLQIRKPVQRLIQRPTLPEPARLLVAQTGSLRCGRLKTCETADCQSALQSFKPPNDMDSLR